MGLLKRKPAAAPSSPWVSPFGTPLEAQVQTAVEAAQQQQQQQQQQQRGPPLPLFLSAVLEFLGREKATTREGIFRLSGRASVVTDTRERLEAGTLRSLRAEDLAKCRPTKKGSGSSGCGSGGGTAADLDVDSAAGLLKLWLRELPVALLTFDLYDCFIGVADFPEEHRAGALAKLVAMLPRAHRAVLRALLQFCAAIVANQSATKMGAHNVAICLAPNILRPAEETEETIVGDSLKSQIIVTALVKGGDALVGDDEEAEEADDEVEEDVEAAKGAVVEGREEVREHKEEPQLVEQARLSVAYCQRCGTVTKALDTTDGCPLCAGGAPAAAAAAPPAPPAAVAPASAAPRLHKWAAAASSTTTTGAPAPLLCVFVAAREDPDRCVKCSLRRSLHSSSGAETAAADRPPAEPPAPAEPTAPEPTALEPTAPPPAADDDGEDAAALAAIAVAAENRRFQRKLQQPLSTAPRRRRLQMRREELEEAKTKYRAHSQRTLRQLRRERATSSEEEFETRLARRVAAIKAGLAEDDVAVDAGVAAGAGAGAAAAASATAGGANGPATADDDFSAMEFRQVFTATLRKRTRASRVVLGEALVMKGPPASGGGV